MYDDNGVRVPVTVLQVRFVASWSFHSSPNVFLLQLENCQVTANVKTVRADHTEYHAVQVAASDRPGKTTTAQMRGHFRRAGVNPKRIVKEFPVTPDAHVVTGEDVCVRGDVFFFTYPACDTGTTLSAIHFVPGQYVDIVAKS
jgi:large subunit ribosomal protein L3